MMGMVCVGLEIVRIIAEIVWEWKRRRMHNDDKIWNYCFSFAGNRPSLDRWMVRTALISEKQKNILFLLHTCVLRKQFFRSKQNIYSTEVTHVLTRARSRYDIRFNNPNI